MQRIFFSLLIAASLVSIPSLRAADARGSKDHPLLKRVTDSEIIWHKTAKFDEITVALERVSFDYDKQDFKPVKTVSAEGAHTVIYYKLPGDVSTLEAVKQYERDLKPAGFETLFTAADDKLDDGYNRFVERTFPSALKTDQLQYLHQFNHDQQRYAALKGTAKGGGTVYVTLYAFILGDVSAGFDKLKEAHDLEKGQTIVRVDVLEAQEMESRVSVVKASEIEKSITETGRAAIYGVLFDTDSAAIKPASAAALEQMAEVIKKGKGKFLIVGHTDNQGDLEHNQELSRTRAVAVTAELVAKHGVSPGRVIPVGVGMSAPTAPNTNEEGRSKNRRVEIVAM